MKFDCRWIAAGLIAFVVGCDAEENRSVTAASQQAAPSATAPAAQNRPATPNAPATGRAPIRFEPAVMNLGELRPSKRVSSTVQVRNTGNQPVTILTAKADCNCTSVYIPEKVIAPGQSVPLVAEYSANILGERKGHVQVLFEGYDPVVLQVNAFVTMPISAEPAILSALKDNRGQQSLFGEFTVKSNDQRPFRILAMNDGQPQYVDYNPASDTSRNSYRLRWDVSGFDPATCMDARGKRMPSWFIFQTDHPDCPIFDVELRHDCTRRIVDPNGTWLVPDRRIQLGPIKAGESVEFDVVAKWRPNKPQLDMANAAVSESDLFTIDVASVTPIDEGVSFVIRLTPKPGVKGMMLGDMRVKSDKESMDLTIMGWVQ